MARPTKQGIDYFPLDVNFDDKVEMFIIEKEAIGLSVLVTIWQMIYSNEGYYIGNGNDLLLLIKKRINVSINELKECINICLERGIFDKKLHEKYNILTSKAIQKRYFEAARRKKVVHYNSDFILIKVNDYDNLINVSKNPVNVIQQSLNVNVKEEVNVKGEGNKPLPSLAEVKLLFKEHNKEQEAEKFYNYYSLNNWTTKAGQPIKDLKAAVKNWIKRDITEAEKKEPTGERRSDYEISVCDEIVKITDADMLQLFANRTWAESAYKKLPKTAQKRITESINLQRSFYANN